MRGTSAPAAVWGLCSWLLSASHEIYADAHTYRSTIDFAGRCQCPFLASSCYISVQECHQGLQHKYDKVNYRSEQRVKDLGDCSSKSMTWLLGLQPTIGLAHWKQALAL